MDVGGWLRRLGLEEYEAAFRENAIDDTVLPSLTADDLKDLGIGIVGHRRKLLDAIAVLHSDVNASSTSTSARRIRGEPSDSVERRQVTVMFCDLVGSTALSSRMDLEDLREVIAAYQECVAETVHRWHGYVAKYMGDGVLVYFGYPSAQEDDAEHAVRAGLEVAAAVAGLTMRVPLQARVGIATGLVVVGDLIGSGEAQERGIVGETPNIAARLQGIADPGELVIAESTRRLVGPMFELHEFGPQELKGIARPVRAWAVLGSRSVVSRFAAQHEGGLTPLVGREVELDFLLRRWQTAASGAGQVVLLSGEPGIGKSRLILALEDQLPTESYTTMRYFCSPQHADSALYPIIRHFERLAEFGYGEDVGTRLDKLDAALRETFSSVEDRALIADLLALDNDGRYPTLSLDPREKRNRTLRLLHTRIGKISGGNPVLLIFEDVHWTDPTSQEFLSEVIDGIRALPVLAVVTFRPEFSPPWLDQPHVTRVALNRLGDRAVAAIVTRLVGDQAVPTDVLTAIAERTDGVPLFVEEMTKAVLEAEDEDLARRTAQAVLSRASSIPASLHASLMARLDRVGSAKQIAQIGAVIGREFAYPVLVSAAAWNEAELREALDRLTETGLVLGQGVPPQATYQFKHALVREAAYGTLLRDARRRLHARVAQAFNQRLPNIAETQPELLAHHYTEAGNIAAAAMLWGKAGRRSHARSALAEAEVQLARALAQIETLPGTPALRRDQISLQVELATVLMHTKGYGAEETKLAADKARTLIEQAEAIGETPDDSLLLLSAIYGFWVGNIASFHGDAASELATQFLALARKQGGNGPLMLAHRMVGMTLMSLGKPADGRAHLDQAITLYDPMEHRPLAARFGTDAQVAILEWRSRALWLLGYPASARQDVEQSFQIAREIGQAATLMHALAHSTISLILLGDYAEAGARARELIGLAEEKGSSYWSANGKMWEGCLAVLTGRPSEAVEILTLALRTYRSTGATIYTSFVLSNLARAHAEIGQLEEALHVVHQAIAETNSTKEKWSEPEIYRILGEIVLRSPGIEPMAAEAHFDRALVLAREQDAKAWELRASMSLFRLWRDECKPVEARELLAPVYGWFTEGFDTPDLKAAKALLDELA
jgi:class 3 adenylate cyclase/predicted ATPase